MIQDIDFGVVQEKIDSSPRGAFSVFVKISDKVGLKLFDNEEDRDDAYDRQFQAAPNGLGPEVYGKVDNIPASFLYTDFEDYNYNYIWANMSEEEFYDAGGFTQFFEYGYLTELVAVCGEAVGDMDIYEEQRRELYDELHDVLGWDFFDCKYANCGIKDGKLICIDFGNC